MSSLIERICLLIRLASDRMLFYDRIAEDKVIQLSSQVRDGNVLPELNKLWANTPYGDLPVAQDFPRLVRRIVIRDTAGNLLFPPAGPLVDDSQYRTVELSKFCILALVKMLEGEERHEEVAQEFLKEVYTPSVRGGGRISACDMYIENLLQCLGTEESSAALRLIKTLNQCFISHCAFSLKKNMAHLTKDVRGPEGWSITIQETIDGVLVKHTRKEQSFDNTKSPWTLKWRVVMVFDHDVKVMEEAKMELVELGLHRGLQSSVVKSVQRDLLHLAT